MQHFGDGLASLAELRNCERPFTVLALPPHPVHATMLPNMEPLMKFAPIIQVRSRSAAQVLMVALRAHGFHPLEPREGGLPGVPTIFGPEGFVVEVPEDEVDDATLLATDLLKDMEGSAP